MGYNNALVLPNTIGHGSGQKFRSRRGINHFPSGTESTLDFTGDRVAGTHFQSAFYTHELINSSK